MHEDTCGAQDSFMMNYYLINSVTDKAHEQVRTRGNVLPIMFGDKQAQTLFSSLYVMTKMESLVETVIVSEYLKSWVCSTSSTQNLRLKKAPIWIPNCQVVMHPQKHVRPQSPGQNFKPFKQQWVPWKEQQWRIKKHFSQLECLPTIIAMEAKQAHQDEMVLVWCLSSATLLCGHHVLNLPILLQPPPRKCCQLTVLFTIAFVPILLLQLPALLVPSDTRYYHKEWGSPIMRNSSRLPGRKQKTSPEFDQKCNHCSNLLFSETSGAFHL